MQKSKVFTKKLIALVLAAIMAVSTFFGVAGTAFAYQNGRYHDNDSTIATNTLSWIEATDDATLEALLDTLDGLLYDLDWTSLNKTVNNLGIQSALPGAVVTLLGLVISFNLPQVTISTSKVVTINIDGRVDSIDGIIDLIFQVKEALNTVKNTSVLGQSATDLIASAANIDINPVFTYLKFDTFGSYFYDSTGSGTDRGYRTSAGSWRDVNSAKYIIRGIIRWVLKDLRPAINDILSGDFELITNTKDNTQMVDIYEIIGNLVGIPKGTDAGSWYAESNNTYYQKSSNGVLYNIAKAAIVNNVGLYKEDTTTNHLKEEGSNWVYDSEVYKILAYYLNKLSFNITYPEYGTYTAAMELKTQWNSDTEEDEFIGGRFEDCSQRRYWVAKQYDAVNADGTIDLSKIPASAGENTSAWDPNLVYSQEEGYEGNVLVTQYNGTQIVINNQDTIYDVVWKALPIIWKTALKPTINLLHVNFNGRDSLGHGTNFDNQFFYWVNENYKVSGEYYVWQRGANYKNNYSSTIVNAWADAVYADYGFESRAEFLTHVRKTLSYESTRAAVNDYYNWRDIDSTILFNEIRYSPLADVYFKMQTGPLNLYFEQTGATAIENFFDGLYSAASDLTVGFNGSLMLHLDNALVTAMQDLFPASDYIIPVEGSLTRATSIGALSTTDSTAVADVVSTLIDDAAKVFKYAADATDANILNPFYNLDGNSVATVITEDNIELALIPLAISALKNWNLTASIHNADWDKVNSIESMAVVALEEYLGYVYPARDYSTLYTLGSEHTAGTHTYRFIEAVSGTTLIDHAIMPMAADALTFVLTAAGMPFFEQTSSTVTYGGSAAVIEPLSYTFVGKGDGLNSLFWQSLNATVCYFGATGTTGSNIPTTAKSIAALANAPSAISASNTIWQNANNVVNTLLPNAGKLIGESSIDLQDLLWNKIVLSAADIAGHEGFTQILTIVGDILTCDLINGDGTQTNGIDTYSVLNVVIFDVVKPLLNLLLGSRTSTSADIITQTKSTTNPINTFLQKANINSVTITNLLNNIMGVLNGTNADASSNSVWMTASTNSIHAAAFILMATHIVPKLGDNTIGGVSAELSEHSVSKNVSTRIAIRNESYGINDAYNDTNNDVINAGRYFARIKSVNIIDSNENAVTSSFTIESSDVSKYTAPTSSAPVYLDPEELTRLNITSNAAMDEGTYRVEVVYDMWRYDAAVTTAGNYQANPSTGYVVYNNRKAVDFFNVAETANDYAWTDGMTNGHASNAQDYIDAGLVTKVSQTNTDLFGPTLIVAGTNAGGSDYGYYVENKKQREESDDDDYNSIDVNLQYATVAASTLNYYLKSGAASSAANANAAWVAINKDGYVLDSEGEATTTTAATLATSSDAVGYIKNADNEIIAVAVNRTAISSYYPGTPLAGVYLNTEAVTVESTLHEVITNTDNTTSDAYTTGSNSQRIISNISDSGLSADYNRMNIVTTAGNFPLTIATGSIDGNYSTLKSTANDLASHYFTASSRYTAVEAKVLPAISKTLAAGVNLDNVANVLDVETEVKELFEIAYATPTTELNAVVNEVIKARRNRHNVDYVLVANYEESVDMAQDVEKLISSEGKTTTVTENGEEKVVPVYEAYDPNDDTTFPDRYQVCDYMSATPCIVLEEGSRVYQLYDAQVEKRADNVFGLLYDEIGHATTPCDDYDEIDGSLTFDITDADDKDIVDFTCDETYHDYPYSTKDDGEWDMVKGYQVFFYDVTNAAGNEMTFKFGSLEENAEEGTFELVNKQIIDGEEVSYTEDSWAAYEDALGECIALSKASDNDTNKKVSAAYSARSHLVIAENNLEIDDGSEEPDDPPVVDTDITVSGTVVMSSSADGATGVAGIGGIYIYTDVNEAAVGTTEADGTFSVTVPQGTTELVLSNYAFANGAHVASSGGTTIDRTVTIAGDSDVAYSGTIGIVICDYNQDGNITGADYQKFSQLLGVKKTDAEYNAFYNINGDSSISGADYQVWSKYVGVIKKSTFTYPALTLE